MLCFVMNLGSSLGLEHTFIFLSFFHANGIFKGFFTIQTLCHFCNQNVQHMDPIVNFRLELNIICHFKIPPKLQYVLNSIGHTSRSY